MTTRPAVSKATVLARYQETSLEPEEHRKMMSSRETWERRFDEAAQLIAWAGVRSWLDVGCGTARLFEKVIAGGGATSLERCLGVDAIANNVATSRAKTWPARPQVRFAEWDIEQLASLPDAAFDLVTMVGVVYQCGLPPADAVRNCLGKLAPGGTLLVTTENPRFKGFVADAHGCYPGRAEFEETFTASGRRPAAVAVQYTNPLWRQHVTDLAEDGSADYKEIFFLVSYGDCR